MSKEPCSYCEGWGNLPNIVQDNFEVHAECPHCKGVGYFYTDDDVTWEEDE
jgi:DnaJ-class molecular chaperone